MPKASHTPICRHCHEPFVPDWRNRKRQQFCHKPECRRASKTASHKAWLTDNPDYFHGREHAERIQGWREVNPKRRRPSSPRPKRSPPDGAELNVPASHTSRKGEGSGQAAILPPDPTAVLQDFIIHNPLMLGLIGKVFGCVLQDDFEEAIGLLLSKGAEAQRRMRCGEPDRKR